MEKFVYYNELFLLYKDFIKDSNREIFDLYYGDNLSMQEIADLKKVSKSRIGAIVKETEKKLENLEKNCKLYKRKEELENIMLLNDIDEIKNAIKELLKQ